ncbi:SlyX family protein [Rhizobacter sp. OV335]|uniref:SlyX family protein n=1 Tax=Rhizobacter sp. OV335 TaxID=1500264 RepID=UPI00091083BA|nr:SlyX family protein [Rhizobacter sp. OV335]SHN33361.1 SlyX protein [Rhizobacter sp. OV335]
MDFQHETDQRLTALEIKASFTEDLLDALNALVARQQQQIEQMASQIALLRQQGAGQDAGAFRSLRDELPPHY